MPCLQALPYHFGWGHEPKDEERLASQGCTVTRRAIYVLNDPGYHQVLRPSTFKVGGKCCQVQ